MEQILYELGLLLARRPSCDVIIKLRRVEDRLTSEGKAVNYDKSGTLRCLLEASYPSAAGRLVW
jgi:hypothetical protein